VAQVETITLGGTWSTNDTATVTINGKDLTLTVGTTATLAELCVQLARMLGDVATEMGAGYIASERGPNVPEFREFTAIAGATTVLLTGVKKGRPFSISLAKNSAAGTLATATTVSATGPHHFDNADNWSGGLIPADGDDLVFDHGAIDCRYALEQSAITPASLRITMGYSGKIGLPATNEEDAAFPYPEYRPRYLALGNAGDGLNSLVTIGELDGPGSGRIMLDTGSGRATFNVLNTGQPETAEEPAVLWKGTHAENVVSISKGSLAIARQAGEQAVVNTLSVGYRTNLPGDARVHCGAGAALTTVNQSGGILTTNSTIAAANLTGGELLHLAGAITQLTMARAAVRYRSAGTLAAVSVGPGGILDFRQDMRSRTVASCDLFAGAELHDPHGTAVFSSGIDLNQCAPAGVTLDLPANRRLTPGNVG
jgi:hypothetical protein